MQSKFIQETTILVAPKAVTARIASNAQFAIFIGNLARDCATHDEATPLSFINGEEETEAGLPSHDKTTPEPNDSEDLVEGDPPLTGLEGGKVPELPPYFIAIGWGAEKSTSRGVAASPGESLVNEMQAILPEENAQADETSVGLTQSKGRSEATSAPSKIVDLGADARQVDLKAEIPARLETLAQMSDLNSRGVVFNGPANAQNTLKPPDTGSAAGMARSSAIHTARIAPERIAKLKTDALESAISSDVKSSGINGGFGGGIALSPTTILPLTSMIAGEMNVAMADKDFGVEMGFSDVLSDQIVGEMPNVNSTFLGGTEATGSKVNLQSQTAISVAQQVAIAVSKNPDGTTELVLNPEELGRISLSMRTHEGSVTLVITTERPDTQEFMRRNIETLMQELKMLGFSDIGCNFAGAGTDSNGSDFRGGATQEGDGEVELEVVQGPQQSVRKDGLDLRL